MRGLGFLALVGGDDNDHWKGGIDCDGNAAIIASRGGSSAELLGDIARVWTAVSRDLKGEVECDCDSGGGDSRRFMCSEDLEVLDRLCC